MAFLPDRDDALRMEPPHAAVLRPCILASILSRAGTANAVQDHGNIYAPTVTIVCGRATRASAAASSAAAASGSGSPPPPLALWVLRNFLGTTFMLHMTQGIANALQVSWWAARRLAHE